MFKITEKTLREEYNNWIKTPKEGLRFGEYMYNTYNDNKPWPTLTNAATTAEAWKIIATHAVTDWDF